MATRSEAPDLAVDELRRRARRRLIGAIILALAAAVLLPLLLENEPKPLGDDVSIQIPPIDNEKFINPLSSGKAQDPKAKGSIAMGKNGVSAVALAADAPATVPPAAGLKASETEKPASGTYSNSSAPAVTPPAAVPDSKPAVGMTGATEVKSAPAAPTPQSESTLDSKTAADAKAATAKTDAAKGGAAFVVQVAAFSDRYGARSLVAKLKRDGFPGYTEAVTSDKGTLHRVRVGPYASREAAATAQAKLKAAGFNGMVAHAG